MKTRNVLTLLVLAVFAFSFSTAHSQEKKTKKEQRAEDIQSIMSLFGSGRFMVVNTNLGRVYSSSLTPTTVSKDQSYKDYVHCFLRATFTEGVDSMWVDDSNPRNVKRYYKFSNATDGANLYDHEFCLFERTGGVVWSFKVKTMFYSNARQPRVITRIYNLSPDDIIPYDKDLFKHKYPKAASVPD